MNTIIKYYTLCAIAASDDRKIDPSEFTKKEIDLYFKNKDDMYVILEDIIGAEELPNELSTRI
jgi:hypothetical protein